jgi:uncharacterized membrane protein YqjE
MQSSIELKNNKEVVLAAVTHNGLALENASIELKNDKEVVLAAVTQNGVAMRYASLKLKSDRKFIIDAMKIRPRVYLNASCELQKDKELVIMYLKKSKIVGAFQLIPYEFYNDRDVMLEAVNRCGTALAFASDYIRRDKQIVLAAVIENSYAIYYASYELKEDKEIVLAAVKHNGNRLCATHPSSKLRNDKQVVLAAVKQTGNAIHYASRNLKADKVVVLAAVKQNWHVIKKPNLAFDKVILYTAALGAIKSNETSALHWASLTLGQKFIMDYMNEQVNAHRCILLILLASKIKSIHLNKLNEHGYYHSMHIKRLIANFIDAPLGNDWLNLCQARLLSNKEIQNSIKLISEY